MAFGGSFVSSGNAYLPAYVPAYADWRHTDSYNGSISDKDLGDKPKALQKKLNKTMKKQAVRAHEERMKYADKFKKFREKVSSQMESEDLTRPAVELVGEELDPDKDLIYVTYVIDEGSKGEMQAVQDFIIKAFHVYGLGEHFREKPEGAVPDEEEGDDSVHDAGDVVVWVWPKRDHDYPEFEYTPIDDWDPEEEEEGGGGF